LVKRLLFFCINLLFLSVNAQNKADSAKIISYTDKVMIRANFDTNVENYTFSEGDEGNLNETILSINNKTKASISVDYTSAKHANSALI